LKNWLSRCQQNGEQLANVTVMMSRMMDRMETLENQKSGEHNAAITSNVITPNKTTPRYWYGVGNGREGSKVYTG
jgi:hypothetical protein